MSAETESSRDGDSRSCLCHVNANGSIVRCVLVLDWTLDEESIGGSIYLCLRCARVWYYDRDLCRWAHVAPHPRTRHRGSGGDTARG